MGEYLIEFRRVGNSVKVTAIDPVTQTEAVIVGAPQASRQQLSELAVRKLEYVLGKK